MSNQHRTFTLTLSVNRRGPRRWAWSLQASNGRKVAQSIQRYTNKQNALRNFHTTARHMNTNPIIIKEP